MNIFAYFQNPNIRQLAQAFFEKANIPFLEAGPSHTNEGVDSNHFFSFTDKKFTGVESDVTSGTFSHLIPVELFEHKPQLLKVLFRHVFQKTKPLAFSELLSQQSETISQTLTHSLQKKDAIEAFHAFAEKCGFKPRCVELMSTAVDELLMNAIFDAPADAEGQQKYANMPRSAAFELQGRDKVEFKMGFSDKLLAISVRDQHGSLNRAKVLKHLCQSYEKKEFKPRADVAGAGLGLSQVFHHSGGMVFECEKEKFTQITVFYELTPTFKEFKEQLRFLSFFMYFP